MTDRRSSRPIQWATQVHSSASATLSRDFRAIGVNFAQCQACRGRWFGLSCAGEAVVDFLSPRLFSTLVAVAAVFCIVAALT